MIRRHSVFDCPFCLAAVAIAVSKTTVVPVSRDRSNLSCTVTAIAGSKTTSLQLTYQVEWGDVDVATTTADWTFGEDTFELVATSRTIGVTDRLRKYRGRTELTGRIEDGRYVPHRLAISGVSKRRSREAFTTWAPATGYSATSGSLRSIWTRCFP